MQASGHQGLLSEVLWQLQITECSKTVEQ